MKVFPNLVEAIINGLTAIFQEGRKADQVVQELLKSNSKWGSRDRRFIADNIYEIVRWYRRLYEVLGHEPNTKQDWIFILAVLWVLQDKEWPALPEFEGFNRDEMATKISNESRFEVLQSIPQWLEDLGREELKEDWEAIVTKLNEEQQVYLRVNTVKCSLKECLLELEKEGVEAEQISPIGIKLKVRKKLQHLKCYKKGWFEVQDRGSQEIVPFMELNGSPLVVDACAGGGGKTLQIVNELKGKGKIIGMDIHAVKLKALIERGFRAGVNNITAVLVNENFDLDLYKEKADFVLIDAPCSGTGVLRRNPDAKWKMTPDKMEEIKETQTNILQDYSSFIKPGGTLVYATCSVFPSENQHQVKKFLLSEKGSAFELVKEKTLFPQELDSDGFYMARMVKKHQS